MMPFSSGNGFRWKLPNATTQTHICACANENSNYWQETTSRCNRERSVERIVFFMNVWISMGPE